MSREKLSRLAVKAELPFKTLLTRLLGAAILLGKPLAGSLIRNLLQIECCPLQYGNNFARNGFATTRRRRIRLQDMKQHRRASPANRKLPRLKAVPVASR
jgi:hypothetical protein